MPPCPQNLLYGIKKYQKIIVGRKIYICDVIQQKVHKVGKRNFTKYAFIENEVKVIKIVFLQKVVGRDI